MFSFLLRRLFYSAVTVVLVASAVFVGLRLTPGDPADLLLPEGASLEQQNRLREEWGLNDAIPTQLVTYYGNLLHGNLGESTSYDDSVSSVVLSRLPATLRLAGLAIVIALALSLVLGITSALKQGTWLDNVISTIVLVSQSIPSFWLGVQLILIFSLSLQWLPSSGTGGWKYMVLPAITLAMDVTALFTRIIRTEMVRTMKQDYVRTAHAKGLRPHLVMLRHVFRNAANPLVTVVGLRLGTLLGGAAITETIFAWPGIGRLAVQAVTSRDYPLVQGVVLLAAVTYSLVNLLIDLLYAMLDPRARSGMT